jgi:GNAT superfamily N-acetyltransferase
MFFKVELIEGGAEGLTQFLDDRIYEYNSTSIGQNDGRLFAMRIRNVDDTIVAGITGWSWAKISEITLLWVNENFRKKGLGKLLLKAAEDEIVKRGCNTILLRSYSFQAPNFYQRNGYRVLFVLDDFPQGYKYYNLIKSLQP